MTVTCRHDIKLICCCFQFCTCCSSICFRLNIRYCSIGVFSHETDSCTGRLSGRPPNNQGDGMRSCRLMYQERTRDHPIGMLQFRQYRCSEEDPHLQDQRNHKTTSAVAMLPITSERKALSVYRTHHIAGHVGCSTFRSDCSGLQGFSRCAQRTEQAATSLMVNMCSHTKGLRPCKLHISLSFSLFSLCLLCML